MANLDELLGTLMVSLARARQIADVQTAAIAEQYRQNPLLEGLSVPRVRVPEMVLEIPLIVEVDQPGQGNELRDIDTITKELVQLLEDSTKHTHVEIGTTARNRFADSLKSTIRRATRISQVTPSAFTPKEVVVRSAEDSALHLLEESGLREKLGPASVRKLVEEIRKRAADIAETSAGRPPTIKVNMLTSDIKDKTSAQSVTRLKIVLKEEGLEWSTVTKDDGSSTRNLQPE